MAELREFMFERVYLGPAVRAEHARIARVVRSAIRALRRAPGAAADGAGAPDERRWPQRVTDYLAGMTDRYCIRAFTELAGAARAFATLAL